MKNNHQISQKIFTYSSNSSDPSSYNPFHQPWSAEELFSLTKSSDIDMTDQMKSEYKEYLMTDLYTEADSHHLYHELIKREGYSSEFLAFIDTWYVDEQNHAAGFLKILHLLYSIDEDNMKKDLKKRSGDFSKLTPFLDDEFKLCVLMAYDEYFTTLAYEQDVFYRDFGLPVFLEWHKKLIKDEARHCMNAIHLIHCKHKHRIAETKGIIDAILQLEHSNDPYRATFLLDHPAYTLGHPDSLVNLSVDYNRLSDLCASQILKSITKQN